MKSDQIIIQVLNNSKSLVFLSRNFGDSKMIGAYLKDKSGALEKVHGKSAQTARVFLIGTAGVVRSIGWSNLEMSRGQRTRTRRVFMSEYLMLTDF